MRWMSILLITLVLLAIRPQQVEAGKTNVYIGISIGGAAVAGGAFLIWSLHYSTRISKRDTFPTPPLSHSYRAGPEDQKFNSPISPVIQKRPSGPVPLEVEVPLLRFQW